SHSGKTELRMILGSHPGLSMTRRTKMWDRFHGRFGDLRHADNFHRCLKALLEDDRVCALNPDEGRIVREFPAGLRSYARLFGLIHQYHAERCGKRRWGEQLQWIEQFADPIFETFPSARMIYMVRNPLSRRSEAAAKGGTRKGRGALGWETAAWLRSVALAERNQRLYPGNFQVVRFESLAADPAAASRKVCSFIEEDYVPEMDRAISSLHVDAQTLPLPSAETASDSAFIDRYAGPSLRALGYPPLSTEVSTGHRLPLVVRPIDRAAMHALTICGVLPPKPRPRR
ncbi:MAG: sulfotransferase, partial [Actinobacteria bacterium]|nr:sulfotransferase [Actinomycetota bacterium]